MNTIEDIIIDPKELYYKKINMLTSFCDTCLDKHQKEKIIMCMFKSQLLDYALDNNLTEDAQQYYKDLDRLLEISTSKTCCTNSNLITSNTCSTCVNGYCAL